MPPRQPEPAYGEFVGGRRLTVEQIGLIQQRGGRWLKNSLTKPGSHCATELKKPRS